MKDYTRDHVISQAFRDDHQLDEEEFGEDWNIQPLHPKCNIGKDGKLREYPLFQCDCHWLRITDAGDMEIVECPDGGVEKAHGLIEGVTTDEYGMYSGSDSFILWPGGHISLYRNTDGAKGQIPDVAAGHPLHAPMHRTGFDAVADFPIADGWQNLRLMHELVKAWKN